MKAFWKEFVLRGLIGMGFGPLVVAIVYGILGATGQVETVTVSEMVRAILSICIMAFIAAGITGIYRTDRLGLPTAIVIHGGVLYLDYLVLYLLNDWVPHDFMALGIFTGIFSAGFALIWVIIFLIESRITGRLNKKLP